MFLISVTLCNFLISGLLRAIALAMTLLRLFTRNLILDICVREVCVVRGKLRSKRRGMPRLYKGNDKKNHKKITESYTEFHRENTEGSEFF